MVGDDAVADVAAAKRIGLRGILVLSGKTAASDLPQSNGPGARQPDAVTRDLAAVVAALPTAEAPPEG